MSTTGLVEVALAEDRDRRGDACARYARQLGLQFGGEAGMRPALQDRPEPLLADADALTVLDRSVGE